MFIRRASIVLSALALMACGDDKPKTAVTPDVTTGTDVAVSADTTTADTNASADTTLPPGCDFNGWTPQGTTAVTVAEAEAGGIAVSILESYSNDEDPVFDVLNIEVYYEFGAETGPKTFTFTAENYADCAYCGVIYAGCTEDACDGTYLAQVGTLNLTANEGLTGKFTGTLSNVKFVEVEIDQETFQSTLVPNGRVFCVDSFAFDQEVQAQQ